MKPTKQHEVVMGNLALKDMSVEEKIATMETLWDDLCQQHLESPSWHADVLQQRDMIRQQGNEQPMSWEEAKQDILKQTQ
ncbi:addiction module protein [Mariprofundus ferrooxydans]|nr:addiction module protein [Mariprofundus ferrooxydans]